MLMVKRYVVYAANCIFDAPPNSDGQYVLVAAAPDLLALAHQYASECGECAGTRVCPDDAPCTECGFIWDVINKAEGKS